MQKKKINKFFKNPLNRIDFVKKKKKRQENLDFHYILSASNKNSK